MNLESLGKIVLIFAFILLLTGSFLYFFGKVLGIREMPGDIRYKRDGLSVYFPLGASIIISILLTIILNIMFLILRNR